MSRTCAPGKFQTRHHAIFNPRAEEKKSPWAALENSVVGSKEGVGGQWGEIVKLVWQHVDPGSFQVMGTLPDSGDCRSC